MGVCPRCGSKDILEGKKWSICDSCGERFLSSASDETKKLKLFFSYSHTDEDICRKIVDVFRDRGHEVWFDRDKIQAGDDWREKIAAGVTSSNGVVAFLTKNSVRTPGVCLNELSIAIGVRGGNIKTVLLEEESSVVPPASIAHIQWLDMSNWKAEKEKGEESFRIWFREKMDTLVSVIETPENAEFSGQITAIRKALPLASYDVTKQKSLLQKPFVGREWLTESIEQWLKNPDGATLCVLYGDPGIGKSAFAANYCHYNARVIASIFCEYNRSNYSRPEAVIQTLAYLLSCRLPQYRVILLKILEQSPMIGELSPADLFSLLLAQPLGQLSVDGGHEVVCIVIDGLDESGDHQKNVLAEVLAQYGPRFPSWIRFLITARRVDSVRNVLLDVPCVELSADADDNQRDIQSYFEQELKEYREEHICPGDFITRLVEKSDGIFLYAQIIIEALQKGKLSPEKIDKLPDGIANAFYCWFGWFFEDPKEYQERFRLVLGMIVFSHEPIPEEEIFRLAGWDENDLEDMIRRIGILLRRESSLFGKQTIEVSHKYLKDWLDSESSSIYGCRRNAAWRFLGKAVFRKTKGDWNKLTEYETLYLFRWLKETGEDDLLQELLQDPVYYLKVNQVGDYCMEHGFIQKAWEYYTAGMQIAKYLLASSTEPDVRLMYSISELNLAEVDEAQGNLKQAEKRYEICYQIRMELNHERGDWNDRKCLGVACERLARVMLDSGNAVRGKELLEQGLTIRDKLDQERGSAEDKRNLGSNCMFLGQVYEAEGDFEKAEELYLKCLKARREQVSIRQEPWDHKDLVVGLIRYVSFLLRSDRIGQVEKMLQESIAVGEEIAKQHPTPEIVRALSYCYAYQAEAMRMAGRVPDAEQFYEKALEHRKILVKERGAKEDYWNLGGIYMMQAVMYFQDRDLVKAEELARKVLQMDEELAQNRGKVEDQKGIIYVCLILGRICQMKNRIPEARQYLERVLPLSRMIYEKRGDFDDREDLAFVLHHLSRIYYCLHERENAFRACEESLTLREKQISERGLCDDRKFYGASLLVKCYFDLNDGNIEAALQGYQKVLTMDRENYQKRGSMYDLDSLCMVNIQIAEFFYRIGDIQKGRDYALEAERLSREMIRRRNIGMDREYAERAAKILDLCK